MYGSVFVHFQTQNRHNNIRRKKRWGYTFVGFEACMDIAGKETVVRSGGAGEHKKASGDVCTMYGMMAIK
jgi:hypothetical protein